MIRPANLRRVRVLQSIRGIRPTTNPYLAMLIEAFVQRDDVKVSFFSFRHAFFGGYDVLHVHWPETMFFGHKAAGRFVRRVLTSLLLVRLAVTRTPIVRTWHNTQRPSELSWWDHRLLDGFDRLTRARIRLNDFSTFHDEVPVVTALLGHYRDWFARQTRHPAVPGRVAYVGLIRRYKGVEDLVRVFSEVKFEGASLRVCGKPSSDELMRSITAFSDQDARISVTFGFVDDDVFVGELTKASLVVLPFLHMHNSSTVLTAISLDRPVLVPDGEVNNALSAEVGHGWIYTYSGELTAEAIDETLRAMEQSPPTGPPNLTARGWADAAERHMEAYRLAMKPRT